MQWPNVWQRWGQVGIGRRCTGRSALSRRPGWCKPGGKTCCYTPLSVVGVMFNTPSVFGAFTPLTNYCTFGWPSGPPPLQTWGNKILENHHCIFVLYHEIVFFLEDLWKYFMLTMRVETILTGASWIKCSDHCGFTWRQSMDEDDLEYGLNPSLI